MSHVAFWLDYIADETPDGSTELHRFDYAFKTNTPFIESVAFSRSGQAVMTQSYDRNGLGRLAGAGATLAGGGTVYGVDYEFDVLNRRFEANLADGTKWDYGYNDRSEVTSGKKKLSAEAFECGKQFEYGFDDIGNRTVTRFGGDATGANLSEAGYGAANALNQLTNREVPGSVWLTGEAPISLALQGIAEGSAFAIERQDGERFFGEALVNNHQEAVFARVTVAGKENGTLMDVETGHEFVPRNPVPFVYDEDGNLTEDGRWNYEWDAENRLVSVTARVDVPEAAKRKVEWTYDYTGRRVRQKVYSASGGSYVLMEDLKFVSDGWRNVAELNATDNGLVRAYSWGLDLSGTLGGAGDVGGLLMINSAHNGAHYCAADGNGNTMALVRAADGTTSANYEYESFGVLLRATGTMALENSFRFSTKRANDATGLVLYEYRAYNPSTGRWLSRDPIEEEGGLNLYAFVLNRPSSLTDTFGLAVFISEVAHEPGAPRSTLQTTSQYLNSSLYYHFPRSDKQIVRYGWSWLLGVAPYTTYFNHTDEVVHDIAEHSGVARARAEIIQELRRRARESEGAHIPDFDFSQGVTPYSLGGVSGVVNYLRDYSVVLHGGALGGNLTATCLGSYHFRPPGRVVVSQISSRACTAEVYFRIYNQTGWESGTRFPITGYLGRALGMPTSTLERNVFALTSNVKALFTFGYYGEFTSRGFGIPSGILSNRDEGFDIFNRRTRLGATTEQFLHWGEIVEWQ